MSKKTENKKTVKVKKMTLSEIKKIDRDESRIAILNSAYNLIESFDEMKNNGAINENVTLWQLRRQYKRIIKMFEYTVFNGITSENDEKK